MRCHVKKQHILKTGHGKIQSEKWGAVNLLDTTKITLREEWTMSVWCTVLYEPRTLPPTLSSQRRDYCYYYPILSILSTVLTSEMYEVELLASTLSKDTRWRMFFFTVYWRGLEGSNAIWLAPPR